MNRYIAYAVQTAGAFMVVYGYSLCPNFSCVSGWICQGQHLSNSIGLPFASLGLGLILIVWGHRQLAYRDNTLTSVGISPVITPSRSEQATQRRYLGPSSLSQRIRRAFGDPTQAPMFEMIIVVMLDVLAVVIAVSVAATHLLVCP